ncbi:MAG TPA: peptide ABC transporter substrate-binding protein [Phycisphaerae bacterium]|nr:peptide ABC transporter substrate-binding protein [Phycisphaerae bacterium]
MSRVLLIPSVVLLVLAAVCYALSGGRIWVGTTAQGERPVVVCNMDDISSLDIHRTSWASDIRTQMALWEGLTAYDPQDLHPVPGVAESWEVTDRGTTYTFHLRHDAKWSNGDPVTAQDFLFAWQRLITPATGADYVDLFNVVKGASEYTEALAEKKEASFSSVGAAAPDAYTVVVHLKAPCSYFLDLCAFPPFFPLNEKSMGDAVKDPANGRWTHPPRLVTNGAYMLTDWRFKQYLELHPNPYYWDRGNVRTKVLRITAISDHRAALLAFDTHTVDLLTFVSQTFGEDLLSQKDPAARAMVHYRPVFGTYYFTFNCARAPLDDARVRQALSLAVDREKIVRDVTGMHQRVLGVLVPPDSVPGYKSPDVGELYDPAKARELLADAGYPGGAGMRPLELLFNNEELNHGKVAMAMGQMWERELGIHVTYRGVERSTFNQDRRSTHNFDIARGGWYGDYDDPTTWLDLARSDSGNNDGQFKDPAYDALMDAAAREFDPAKRFAILAQAEKLICGKEFPFLMLYQYGDGFMYDANHLKGVSDNVRLITPLKWIWRDPA